MNNDKDNIELDDIDLGESALVWDGVGKYPPVGSECECNYPKPGWYHIKYMGIGMDGMHVVSYKGGDIDKWGSMIEFRPIETPEQKETREIDEAAEHLHDIGNSAYFGDKAQDVSPKWSDAPNDVKRMWIEISKTTGFRKPE